MKIWLQVSQNLLSQKLKKTNTQYIILVAVAETVKNAVRIPDTNIRYVPIFRKSLLDLMEISYTFSGVSFFKHKK